MTALWVANLLLLVCVVWVIWERRLTIGSHFDSPITVGAALFGTGVALTSPWPVVYDLGFPIVGKFLMLIVVGQFCFLSATALAIKAVYLRLLPDAAVERFMRRRIAPLVAGAGATLVVCCVASSLTLTRWVDRTAFAPLDGWLAACWIAYFVALGALGLILAYGVSRLRADPRSAMLRILFGSVLIASLSAAVVGYAVVSRGSEVVWIVVWLVNYAAFWGLAVAFVVQWRRRLQTFGARQ